MTIRVSIMPSYCTPFFLSHSRIMAISPSCALMTSSASFTDLRIFTMGQHNLGHINGTLMMRDHALDEIHVGIPAE